VGGGSVGLRSPAWDDLLVQGVEGPGRELWDAGEVVGHLVAAGSMFAILAEHRGELFPDEDYADLFTPGVGRPSLPATRDGGGADPAGAA
jgi:hypothetical protein